MSRTHMPTDSTLFDTLTAVQQKVLQALVEGQSISAAAPAGRSDEMRPAFTAPPSTSGPQNTPTSPVSSSPPATNRADCLLDELSNLADLALDTFRQILSDGKAPAASRLKAAMEIVKLVEAQRPTFRETTITEVQFDRVGRDLLLHQIAEASQPAPKKQNVGRNCCGNPVTQTRAA